MLTYKDLQLVLDEIERLNSIIKEAINKTNDIEIRITGKDFNYYLKNKTNDIEFRITGKDFNYYLKLKDIEQGKELLEILDKVEEN